MNLLILDGVNKRYTLAARYRGTDRGVPTYCEAVPKNHEINRLFMWYLDEGGEAGVVHDLQRAKRYTELCNLYFSDKHFEVIEFSTSMELRSDNSRQFLGFDLSEGGCGHSLVAMALLYEPEKRSAEEPAFVLGDLIRSHYVPKLNEFGLFGNPQDALDCRAAMSALQSFRPGLYESGSLEDFETTAIYLDSPLIT